MRRRVLHWIGWTLGFSLLPLLAIAVTGYADPAPGRSVSAFLATGDIALTAVAWLAASMSEMRDTRAEWSAGREALGFLAVFLIVLNAAVFGVLYGDRTRGTATPTGTRASRRIVVAGVTDVVLAGILSTAAVAVGTSKERERS